MRTTWKPFSNKTKLTFLFCVLFIFSNGCAEAPIRRPLTPRIISNVTSFHNITGTIEKKTVWIKPSDASLVNSLQFQTYAKTIASYLVQYGFSVALENQAPDYVVFVSYGIGPGKTITKSMPVFGAMGGGTTTNSGTVYGTDGNIRYSGESYTMPTYGVVGSRTSTQTQFTRNLAIDIVDASSLVNPAKPIKIYEGRVQSTGKCGGVNYVMSEMIESMFRNFPGRSGTSRQVTILQYDGSYYNC